MNHYAKFHNITLGTKSKLKKYICKIYAIEEQNNIIDLYSYMEWRYRNIHGKDTHMLQDSNYL